MRSVFISILAVFLSFSSLSADELTDITLFSHVINLTHARAPYFFSDYLIFSYQTDQYVRSVGLVFAHEGYRRIHPYKRLRDRPGLFYYVVTPPKNLDRLEYRLVIDGVWGADPLNSAQSITDNDEVISLVTIPPTETPHREAASSMTRFELSLDPLDFQLHYSIFTDAVAATDLTGRRVSLVGEFNRWDPYFHRMMSDPASPHTFFIDLPLPPGKYPYYFMVDGLRLLDPREEHRLREKSRGHFVSVKTVK